MVALNDNNKMSKQTSGFDNYAFEKDSQEERNKQECVVERPPENENEPETSEGGLEEENKSEKSEISFLVVEVEQPDTRAVEMQSKQETSEGEIENEQKNSEKIPLGIVEKIRRLFIGFRKIEKVENLPERPENLSADGKAAELAKSPQVEISLEDPAEVENKSENTGKEGNGPERSEEGPVVAENNLDRSQTQRAQWGRGTEFLMSCIAMSVGLGNIWRFPFAAKKNGGGAFLIPYLIVLIVIGRPMYYMEMSIGQFTSKGNCKMFSKLSPMFRAIGYGQVIGAFSVATYYCSIMAVTLYYLFASFTSEFPWSTCNESWINYTEKNGEVCIDKNTNPFDQTLTKTISSSELFFSVPSKFPFFRIDVLKQKDDISDGIGIPDLKLTLFLVLAWLITFILSVRGIKSSGKASYFLAIFPYVILIVLLIKALTLEGATDGILYFIETDWSKLLEAQVWYAAVTQCFFSLNVGFGTIIMLSSYNSFNHNINRDALIITTLDTFTSLLSGVTIFGILGSLAHEMNVEPSEVISHADGTSLAFISYPEAISKFTAVPWLFAIMFFFMLFILGLGSLQALQGTLNTAVKDAFPTIAMWKISACTATLCLLIGLLYMTPAGQYILDLADHFGGTFIIYTFAILEVIVICWLYGVENICIDIEFMTKKKVGIYWRVCWAILMPVLLILIYIYFIFTQKPLVYGDNKSYPIELQVFGWSILGIGVLQMFFWIGYYLYANRRFSAKEMLRRTFSTEHWGPDSKERTEEWKRYKEALIREREPIKGNWFKRKVAVLVGR
ncbi:unnamed protein product [Acanthoscelides obtectus]|uniref:Transporter n=1 Tax=Acanthoscelides obtectus TaxID=200917 RepID=A0A9P0KWJ7_ACAOB|nr:unnamed protein product [Acanthoscelides obtectus]CAK1650917.1 Sodium-dependent nutrient amino acid transporter 1 [Acanthoscelides obtectus]